MNCYIGIFRYYRIDAFKPIFKSCNFPLSLSFYSFFFVFYDYRNIYLRTFSLIFTVNSYQHKRGPAAQNDIKR